VYSYGTSPQIITTHFICWSLKVRHCNTPAELYPCIERSQSILLIIDDFLDICLTDGIYDISSYWHITARTFPRYRLISFYVTELQSGHFPAYCQVQSRVRVLTPELDSAALLQCVAAEESCANLTTRLDRQSFYSRQNRCTHLLAWTCFKEIMSVWRVARYYDNETSGRGSTCDAGATTHSNNFFACDFNSQRHRLKVDILQGSAATRFGCGEIFDGCLVATFPESVPVKEFWKSVGDWLSYRYELGVPLFWNTV